MAQRKDGPDGSAESGGTGEGRRRRPSGKQAQDGETVPSGSRAGSAAGGRKSASPRAADGGAAPARRGGRSGQPDLQKELRDFASARPQGWNHEDWLNFLTGLEERGHNIVDREAIGLALEKERLNLALSQVKGVGPQRRQALIERFGNVWTLRNADASEIASAASIPPSLAEEIRSRVGNN